MTSRDVLGHGNSADQLPVAATLSPLSPSSLWPFMPSMSLHFGLVRLSEIRAQKNFARRLVLKASEGITGSRRCLIY